MAKKNLLRSSDSYDFEVDEIVALKSQTIKHMIEDEDDCADIYCEKHVADDQLESWDAEFVNVDQSTLFDLLLAATYLNIKSL
ncbi:hypothetical protein RND81_11G150300 [Saponaria officinalis]|uniref:SKP1 component POZ domain-containing protein n=1 Tax=Saponaria officinalis TaxID=3572 RepID=A0AAW1HNY9_SAPOF